MNDPAQGMKEIIDSVGAKRVRRQARSLNQLLLSEMEHELDRCPAPWQCPATCYAARDGCDWRRQDSRRTRARSLSSCRLKPTSLIDGRYLQPAP